MTLRLKPLSSNSRTRTGREASSAFRCTYRHLERLGRKPFRRVNGTVLFCIKCATEHLRAFGCARTDERTYLQRISWWYREIYLGRCPDMNEGPPDALGYDVLRRGISTNSRKCAESDVCVPFADTGTPQSCRCRICKIGAIGEVLGRCMLATLCT